MFQTQKVFTVLNDSLFTTAIPKDIYE